MRTQSELTVSTGFVKSILNAVSYRGSSHQDLAQKCEISNEDLELQGRVSIQKVWNLWTEAEAKLKDPAIALVAAQAYQLGDFGEFEYIARNSETFFELLKNLEQFQRLSHDFVQFKIVEETDGVFFKQNLLWQPRGATHHGSEFTIALLYLEGRRLTQLEFNPLQVHFRHQCQTNLKVYEDFFGCKVYFNSDSDGILFDLRMLQMAFPAADPKLQKILKSGVQSFVGPSGNFISPRISSWVAQQLSLGLPADLSSTSKEFHMSERTLQRKLKSEGATFKELLDRERKGVALRLLNSTDLEIIEIAAQLGFSDTSSFYKFLRKMGSSVSSVKKSR